MCGCTALNEAPALWTVPPCTQILGEVCRGGQGIFCGSHFVLNTFKGAAAQRKTHCQPPLCFSLWRWTLAMCLGSLPWRGATPQRSVKHLGAVGWGLSCFCYAILSGECPKPQPAEEGFLGATGGKKNLKKQPLCSVFAGRAGCEAVAILGLGAYKRQPFECFNLLLPI